MTYECKFNSNFQCRLKENQKNCKRINASDLRGRCKFLKSMPHELKQDNPIMKYFTYKHLPEKLQVISEPFCELAETIDEEIPNGPEKSAGLRKLLEAKDCIVRAALDG